MKKCKTITPQTGATRCPEQHPYAFNKGKDCCSLDAGKFWTETCAQAGTTAQVVSCGTDEDGTTDTACFNHPSVGKLGYNKKFSGRCMLLLCCEIINSSIKGHVHDLLVFGLL